MKIHPPLEKTILYSLDLIFNQGKPAEITVERALKSDRKFGAKDRKFIAENLYDLIRHFRGLCVLSSLNWKSEKKDWSEDDFSALLHKLIELKAQDGLVEALKDKPRVEAFSLTDELDGIGVQELGGEWDNMVRSLNQVAPVFIRVNSLKTTKKELQKLLQAESIEVDHVKDLQYGLLVKDRKNLFQTQAFRSGLFEIQDGGSQKIAPFLEVEPGMKVVDACAGAGGKSLHLAALMQNKGKLIALDINENKLNALKLRARRAGLSLCEIRPVTNQKVIKRLHGQMDRVLLDVPCSGSGALRRHPGDKWKINKKILGELILTQSEIFKNYSKMLKPGGVLVYATCSLFPSENEAQVESFLNSVEGEGFTLVDSLKTSPLETDFDGFYAAKLSRDKT